MFYLQQVPLRPHTGKRHSRFLRRKTSKAACRLILRGPAASKMKACDSNKDGPLFRSYLYHGSFPTERRASTAKHVSRAKHPKHYMLHYLPWGKAPYLASKGTGYPYADHGCEHPDIHQKHHLHEDPYQQIWKTNSLGQIRAFGRRLLRPPRRASCRWTPSRSAATCSFAAKPGHR